MRKITEFVELHCAEGGSDKAYICAIEEVDGGYVVPFAYGRVGSTLTLGCKTSVPVDESKARKVYEKLVKEKVGKGYVSSPGISDNIFGIGVATSSPSPTATAAMKTDSGHRPQLLNPITPEEAVAYNNSSLWGLQEKMDGDRRAIRSTKQHGIEGINRKGQIVPLHPELIAEVAKKVSHTFLIDGEIIGSTLYAFDLLELDGKDLRSQRYIDRYNALLMLCADMKKVEIVPLALTTSEKQSQLNRIKLDGGEGVVYKRLDAIYTEGRPSSGGTQLKLKFWESAACVVTANNDLKRSVSIAATDAEGSKLIPVGNVTIPPNHDIPAVTVLVEVKYLYYYQGGSLYQPQYLGVRSDADMMDCDISKLKRVQELGRAA